MAKTSLMQLPKCHIEGHGKMKLRPVKGQSYEEKYCGVWYDCQYPGCKCSILYMSPELRRLYESEDK